MAGLSRLAFGGDMTILLVEQRIQSALAFATHALIMERGQIAWSGTPAELKEAPHLVERLLGVAGDE
jgi:branched-chain amino acid transport system ATP-binding protein